MNEEKIPFNVCDLESMCGKEFYVTLVGNDLKRMEKINYDGILSEVISREPHSLDLFTLGGVNLFYEDNSAFTAGKDTNYVFVLKHVDLTQQPPKLYGRLQIHNMHTDRLGLVYDVCAALTRIEPSKTKTSIGCA